MHNPEQITYFADTDARNRRVRFGIKAKDRTRHVYVIGKTGMGKSTILENMAAQDVQNGNGFAFIDPHGSAIDTILRYVTKDRVNDVLYFAPFDMENPISFNVMEDVGYDKRHLVVSGLMSTFKKIWVDAWSARMEYILGNTLLALLEYPDTTLLDVNRMLSDKVFRNRVVAYIKDASVKTFWTEEFARYTERMAAEATPAIQNKIGQFTANPLIRNIIGQPKSSFDLRKIMDERKIVLVNLSKGRVGESNANLLGSMLITKMYLSAMSRSDLPKEELEKLPNFYLYVDEFQSFANESFADILSEARKYKLNLTIAHQYIEQMSDEVRAAVFGNVGTMITFRVGSYDAEVLEKEFSPTFEAKDIVNLGAYQIYLRLMIDGISSQPFSARTMPPLEMPSQSLNNEVIAASRRNYARSRTEVEQEIEKNFAEQSSNRQSNSGGSEHNSSSKAGNDSFQKKKPVRVIDNKSAKQIQNHFNNKNNKPQQDSNEVKNESLSLKDLQAKTQSGGGKDKKGPSKENSKSLKEALMAAGILDKIGNDQKNKHNHKDVNDRKKEAEHKNEKQNITEKKPQGEVPKENLPKPKVETPKGINEIAEEELRKILEV